MSFSTTVKNEIARTIPESKCCKKAELSGLIRVDGTILIGAKWQLSLEVKTENAAVARKFLKLMKLVYNIETQMSILRKNRLKKNYSYRIKIAEADKIKDILVDLGISDDGFFLNSGVSREINENSCCKRAFLRGVFLGSGSVIDPETGYHMELVLEDEEFAKLLVTLLNSFELTPKINERKGYYIVYLKESEQIVTFLSIIGAYNGVFAYENIRIQKGVRNKVNRLVNCETANLNKSIDASFKQIENIKLIDEKIGIENLPENLQIIANLRLENPDVSLRELGEMLHPPLSKSGINHRIRKIDAISKKIREKE